MLSFSSSPVVDRTALSTSGDDFADSPSSSLPPSGAPSRSGSRAPSMSGGTSGGKLGGGVPTLHANGMNDKTVTPSSYSSVTSPTSPSSMTPTHARSGKPPSVHSDTGGSKFTLKDLLATAPKVTRKASQRSTGSRSSRVSDSDAGSTDGGKAKSRSDSAVSLTQKYGVCQKVAIGKGATSVVRLAHKWDRSEGEEKLYAVKVSITLLFLLLCDAFVVNGLMLMMISRNSGSVVRTSRRKNTSRSLPPNSASLLRCTTQTSSKLST